MLSDVSVTDCEMYMHPTLDGDGLVENYNMNYIQCPQWSRFNPMSSLHVKWKMKLRTILVVITILLIVSLELHLYGDQLLLLLSPCKVHKNESEKYVIYTCDGSVPCGGWADRQKGIVSSFVLATMLGRKFRIKMTSPCELSHHLMPTDVPWQIQGEELRGLCGQVVDRMDANGDKLRKEMVTMDLAVNYTQDILYFTGNMEYVEYLLQNDIYSENTAWMREMSLPDLYVYVLNKLFRLKGHLKRRLTRFQSKIPQEKDVNLVCAQVRLGRNPTVPKDSEFFNSMRSVKVLWSFLKQFNDTDKYRIFVTSDSELVRRKARYLFPDTIVDLEGDIVHVDRTKGSKVCDGFAKVILDQLILSTCDTLIISRSGLARIAAWYRGRADNVFCFSKSKVKACDPYNLTALIPSW